MRHIVTYKTCPNKECKRTKLAYTKGTGRFSCKKCHFSTNYFADESLVFLFTYGRVEATKESIAYDTWRLEGAYYDSHDWLLAWDKLPEPKAIIHWNMHYGCELWKFNINSLSIDANNQFKLDIMMLDQFGNVFDIFTKVSVFIKEWAAGITFPIGWNYKET